MWANIQCTNAAGGDDDANGMTMMMISQSVLDHSYCKSLYIMYI